MNSNYVYSAGVGYFLNFMYENKHLIEEHNITYATNKAMQYTIEYLVNEQDCMRLIAIARVTKIKNKWLYDRKLIDYIPW